MRRRIAILALAAALGGCTTEYFPPAPPAPPLPRRPPVDSCGAASLQYLVGRPVAEIPQTSSRHEQRVIGQGVDVQGRFYPDRLTIVYDDLDGRITRVRCG